MEGMINFHQRHPEEDLREVDFENMPPPPDGVMPRERTTPFPFTAEAALTPLVAELEAVASRAG